VSAARPPVAWPHDPNLVARAVLAEPAFRAAPQATATAAPPSLLDVLWRWFLEHVLRPLLHPLASAFSKAHLAAPLGWVLIALALVAFTLAAARFALAFARSPPRKAGAGEVGRPLRAWRGAEEWLALAYGAARAGDYARAIAALFAAALARLDERGIVAFDPARTPGEYRRLVRRACAAAAGAFDELALRFARAVYARGSADRDDFEAAEHALRTFEPATRRT
jgi:hypothetical protein